MTVHFYDDAHEAFFREKLERAAASGRTPDNYFRSFLYLCGLCPDTRSHFHRLFDWREWCICPEALADGGDFFTGFISSNTESFLWMVPFLAEQKNHRAGI